LALPGEGKPSSSFSRQTILFIIAKLYENVHEFGFRSKAEFSGHQKTWPVYEVEDVEGTRRKARPSLNARAGLVAFTACLT
jgi:hypothetical protein